jgi:hypothetical protein
MFINHDENSPWRRMREQHIAIGSPVSGQERRSADGHP